MGGKTKTDIQKVIFFLIIILAFFLRFYQLGQNPPSLTWDEASLGYNAYSLLKTEKDEYGNFLPFSLRSFGDYKPALYAYLTIPSIALFGLSEFAVRFPSALFGTLTVLITYFLVKELFFAPPQRWPKDHPWGVLPLVSSFLLAISPWHLHFSRAAFEANLGLFLAIFATYLFLKSLQKQFLLLFSAFFFSLSLYAYHSLRVFSPLLVLFLSFIYRKKLLKMKKWVIASFLTGIIFVLPLVNLAQEGILARFSGVSAFADPALLSSSIRKIEEDGNTFFARMIHNRRIIYTLVFLKNYLSHFDPNFLFIYADQNPRHHAPSNGLLYFWEIATVPFGVFVLTRTKGRGKFVIFCFLLLAPVASAPTRASPHAIRFLNSLLGWIITSSLGLSFLLQKLKKLKWLLIIFILGNFLYWFNLYFFQMPREVSQDWQYGYKQIVEEAVVREKDYDKILVTGAYDQPYIFFLFYQKYDPKKYQQEFGNPKELPRYERNFGKYQFLKEIDLSKAEKGERILIVASPKEVGGRKDFKIFKRINFLDGSPAFLIGERI